MSEEYFAFFTKEILISVIETLINSHLKTIDLELWESNSEEFIEMEDDLHLTKESNMD